ncbi:MAG: LmbU family transcriptional regulator [Kibdelosporangium sp.]
MAELARSNDGMPGVMPRTVRSPFTQVRMSGIGLQIPASLNYDEWAKTGRQLSGIADSSAWWLGDWLVFGKANYSDRYQLAIQSAGLRYQTLRNYAWVARRFEMDRRRPKLTFKHHAEVASLPAEEQDRFLDQAEQELWTTKQLRNAITQGHDAQSERPVAANSRIDVPKSRVGMWREAADRAGIDFDQWVLTMLDRAATEVLVPEYAEVLA